MRSAKLFRWVLALAVGLVSGGGVAWWLSEPSPQARPKPAARTAQRPQPVVAEPALGVPQAVTASIEAAVSALAEVATRPGEIEAETAKVVPESAPARIAERSGLQISESASLQEARQQTQAIQAAYEMVKASRGLR